MARLLFCCLLVVALSASANVRAQPAGQAAQDTVALLPLDAGPKLELYGQPVASEISRALIAGSIDVVVVGPKMAVPERARLIVDGTMAQKGDAVVLTLRVRNRTDGKVLVDNLSATASSLANLDRAAAELSGRLLPVVREQLRAVAKPITDPTRPVIPDKVPTTAPARKPVVLVSVASPAIEPMRSRLADAVSKWTAAHGRELQSVDAIALDRKIAAQTVARANAERGILFQVLSFKVTGADVPLARARVRVRISDGNQVLFDRVVVTDTIVGDRQMPVDAIAARVATEVLAILRPHMRRTFVGWQ